MIAYKNRCSFSPAPSTIDQMNRNQFNYDSKSVDGSDRKALATISVSVSLDNVDQQTYNKRTNCDKFKK